MICTSTEHCSYTPIKLKQTALHSLITDLIRNIPVVRNRGERDLVVSHKGDTSGKGPSGVEYYRAREY
jgi:hypothetical protein